MNHERVEIIVRGRVQGVGYRDLVQREAKARKLIGWVRNEPDGTVRAHAEGPREALEAWLEALHIGTGLSKVDRIEETWMPPQQMLGGFDVIW